MASPEQKRRVGIKEPNPHDVLCGRGGCSNNHHGNAIYRLVVSQSKEGYNSVPKHRKILVARAIVEAVSKQDPPGRFLDKNKEDGLWYEVEFSRAVEKTKQALREKITAPSSSGRDSDVEDDPETKRAAASIQLMPGLVAAVSGEIAPTNAPTQMVAKQRLEEQGGSGKTSFNKIELKKNERGRKRTVECQSDERTDSKLPRFFNQGMRGEPMNEINRGSLPEGPLLLNSSPTTHHTLPPPPIAPSAGVIATQQNLLPSSLMMTTQSFPIVSVLPTATAGINGHTYDTLSSSAPENLPTSTPPTTNSSTLNISDAPVLPPSLDSRTSSTPASILARTTTFTSASSLALSGNEELQLLKECENSVCSPHIHENDDGDINKNKESTIYPKNMQDIGDGPVLPSPNFDNAPLDNIPSFSVPPVINVSSDVSSFFSELFGSTTKSDNEDAKNNGSENNDDCSSSFIRQLSLTRTLSSGIQSLLSISSLGGPGFFFSGLARQVSKVLSLDGWLPYSPPSTREGTWGEAPMTWNADQQDVIPAVAKELAAYYASNQSQFSSSSSPAQLGNETSLNSSRRMSLMEDFDETPMETRLRSLGSTSE